MAANTLLQHQALTISQQIEELKNWHKQQQSKLSNGSISTQKDNLTENSLKKPRNEQIYETVPENNRFKNPTMQQNFDDLPIKVVNPTFNDIIENNIVPNEAGLGSLNDIPKKEGAKPKFQFLKKGEGIARFRMEPSKVTIPRNKSIRTLNLSKGPRKSFDLVPDKHQNDVSEKTNFKNSDEIPTLKPPDLKLKFKNWRAILNSGKAEEYIDKAIEDNHLEMFQSNSSIDSSIASIMEKIIVIGRKQIKEKEELRVFELMEQQVLDSSFCSTSSNIAKLMENAVISTPEKSSVRNHRSSESTDQANPILKVPSSCNDQKIDTQYNEHRSLDSPLWTIPESIKDVHINPQDETNMEDLEPSLHVRFCDQVDYKSFVEYSQSLNNTTQQETNRVTEFDESEEWKEDSEEDSRCCSQCSTSYSSSDEDVRAISPPIRPPSVIQNNQGKQSKSSSKAQNDRRNKIEQKQTTDLVSANTQGKNNSMPSNGSMEKIEPLLGAKVKELESEIENFRTENKKLRELRESLEKERKQFQQEKKKLLQEVDQERKKNAALLEEEKQKLAKEKFIFEKYSKSLTKNPTKEERKEMQGLREQLSEIKEELNRKESRWAAAQARVRNQVKILEDDNKKLREEVEVLRKQSRHLEFLTKQKKVKPFNNTKLIHAINDHISNIAATNKGDVEVLSEEGYFNKKSNTCKVVHFDEVDPKTLKTVKVIKETETKHVSKPTCDKYSEVLKFSQKSVVENDKSSTEVNPNSTKEQVYSRQETCSVSKNSEPIQEIVTDSPKGIVSKDDHIEKVFPDGRKEFLFKNGNIKKVDPVTGNEKTIYFNGDVKEILRDGTVKYYFSDSRRWQTTFPDGLEVWDFPNGQVEKRHTNGMVEITFPNDVKKICYPDGSEEIFYADGTTLKTEANKKILSLPNGQKEIHTDECVRREYPDGTVKKLYPDGTTETVYANGRVRVKDKHENLIMDSGTVTDRRL